MNSQRTILLVEDDVFVGNVTKETIRKLGYVVVYASSSAKALEYAMSDGPLHLILMDIDLGEGLDGTEVARRILVCRHVPIVFLTSHAEEDMVEKVRGITRYGYVVKASGDFVLQSSIEMAIELFEAHQQLEAELRRRKHIEKELKQSESRIRGLYDHTPTMLHSFDADGKLSSVSEYWLGTMGYLRDEVIGHSFVDYLTEPSQMKAREQFIPELHDSGINKNVELQFVKKNGEILDTLLSVVAERGESGIVDRYLAVVTDVTEHKRTQEALHRSDMSYRLLVDNLKQVVFQTDTSGNWVFLNPAWEEVTGYKVDESLGKLFLDFVHPDDRQKNLAL